MKTTRLSVLMQYLHIKVIDLAKHLHIDPSLASRWKNGNRPLLPSSAHFDNIVDYIFKRDKRASYTNIKVFLKEYFPEKEFSDDAELKECLSKWLAGYSSVDSGRKNQIVSDNEDLYTFSVFRGDKNKKEALLNFLDISLLLPTSKKIYIMIGSDMNHHLEKDSFYRAWIDRLFKALNHGHQVYFIYNYAQNRGYANNLRNFFYLSSSEQYYCYYVPTSGKLSISFGLFIIEGTCALTDFISCSEDRNSPLFSFTSLCIIDQLEKQYEALLTSCKLLTNRSTIKRSDELNNFIRNRIAADGNIYIYDEMPLSFPVLPEILKDILLNSNTLSEDAHQIAAKYEDVIFKPFTMQSQNSHRYIFNIQAFIENMESESQVFLPSIVSESNIVISHDYYYCFIESMLAMLSASDSPIEIALIDNGTIADNSGIMTMIKENLFTYVSPYLDTMNHLDSVLFTHPSIVSDAYEYYDRLWAALPDESKNLHAIKAQLKRLLDKLKSNRYSLSATL